MKLVVLGGGPAGYVAALRAAQLGAQVTVVEAREIGGTCLNRGCIPTKSLVESARRLRQARDDAVFGVVAGEPQPDLPAMMARKSEATRTLREGVEHLLKARKVEIVAGRGRLSGARTVVLEDGREVEGDALLIATGSDAVRLPIFDFADERVMTSDELLAIDRIPRRLAIIGGGVIGCEFASVFAALGSQVTVIEMLDQLLPGEDKRVGKMLQQAFKRQGIAVLVKHTVEATREAGDGDLILQLAGGAEVAAATVLVSVGRRPMTRDLGLEEAGVGLDENGFVVADATQRTFVGGVFAAGDAAGPPLLAHWAYHQGAVAAENAVTGSHLEVDRRVVPNCVFSHPEVATCGITEGRAAAAGLDVAVAGIRLNGNSKAVIEGDAEGFVRIVVEQSTGIVLGASMVGPHVTELIHEIALAASAKLPLAAVRRTIHAHPTLAEAVGEAALVAAGRGMHSL